MATIILKNAIFMHVPKTGGTWIARNIEKQNLALKVIRQHPDLNKVRKRNKQEFVFGFVRDPLTWWQSYWGHRMRGGWRKNEIDNKCKSNDFNEFITNVVQHPELSCYYRFEKFLGSVENEVDFIGKFENIKKDLIKALTLANVSFDKNLIYKMRPINVGEVKSPYNRTTKQLMLDFEQETIKRFNY